MCNNAQQCHNFRSIPILMLNTTNTTLTWWTRSPCVHCMPTHAVWSVRLLEEYRWGNSSLFFYLLFCIWGKKYTCPVSQLPTVWPPPFTRIKSRVLETNSHFTPELLLCASGDLAISNLVYSAHLFQCKCPTFVVSMKISFISLFFILGWRFACGGRLQWHLWQIASNCR